MTQVTGTSENPYSGSLSIVDDTGLAITVATGGTYQAVKHASTMVAGSTAVGITASPTNGTLSIPQGASGRYLYVCTGVALPTNSKTVVLGIAKDSATSRLAAASGGSGARIVGAGTALEEHFSFSGIVAVDASSAAVTLGVICTSTDTNDTVNFKRFNLSVVRIGA